MEYTPIAGVWEITMGCNMRCKHCGSACEGALPGELSTSEALALCKDLGSLGIKCITLSGGEPTLRSDWDQIAGELGKNGIIANMITNGWSMNENIIERALKAGINTIAFSLDGLKDTHDYIRKAGSFDRIMQALDLMKDSGLHRSIITTVNKKNSGELPELLALLEKKGIEGWQIQMGVPMGSMSKNIELLEDPECVDHVINFAHKHYKNTSVEFQLADCIGYYSLKEVEVRTKRNPEKGYMWQGCGAGKRVMGILHNGDIIACTSIRDRRFVEGNIREKSLLEIWNGPTAFLWSREMSKQKLSGFCARCRFGELCLGGCSNTRLTIEGDIYKENRYCSYYTTMKKVQEQFSMINEVGTVIKKARFFLEKGDFQLGELALRRGMELQNDNIEILGLLGYTNFMLQNYQDAKEANTRALGINGNDVYANKGMGLTLCKLGEVEAGISHLRKAVEFSDENFMDPWHDLALALIEQNRHEEAYAVLCDAKDKSPSFYDNNKPLFEKTRITA